MFRFVWNDFEERGFFLCGMISLSVNLQVWEMLSAKNKSQLSCHNIALV